METEQRSNVTCPCRCDTADLFHIFTKDHTSRDCPYRAHAHEERYIGMFMANYQRLEPFLQDWLKSKRKAPGIAEDEKLMLERQYAVIPSLAAKLTPSRVVLEATSLVQRNFKAVREHVASKRTIRIDFRDPSSFRLRLITLGPMPPEKRCRGSGDQLLGDGKKQRVRPPCGP